MNTRCDFVKRERTRQEQECGNITTKIQENNQRDRLAEMCVADLKYRVGSALNPHVGANDGQKVCCFYNTNGHNLVVFTITGLVGDLEIDMLICRYLPIQHLL
jgi:hypothetical protein